MNGLKAYAEIPYYYILFRYAFATSYNKVIVRLKSKVNWLRFQDFNFKNSLPYGQKGDARQSKLTI